MSPTAESPVKLTISLRHGGLQYDDELWWDWRAPTTPEEFAARTVSDLGMPLQMTQAIAMQIRMQTIASLLGIQERADGQKAEDGKLGGATICNNRLGLSKRIQFTQHTPVSL